MQGLLDYVASRTIDSDLGWINQDTWPPADIVSGEGGGGQTNSRGGNVSIKDAKTLLSMLVL